MENILFVCSHSDDHIFGAGGTIAKYTEEGKKVHVVILSYGETSHLWLKPSVTKKMRSLEAFAADEIVGSKSEFFDLKEGHYMEGYPEIKSQLVAKSKKLNPSKVFTHTNEDPHPDHRAAHNIALDIIKEANIKPEVYVFSIWNPFSFRKSHLPRMYIDISTTHAKKIAAIKKFKSQWAAIAVLFAGILAREVKNGLHIGKRYAESFYRL